MTGQTISHYQILEKLGEGGMGVVYKARDTKLDRIVALKFLPQDLTGEKLEKERFHHEARATSALMHPNVTVIHEISEHDSRLFLAMEFVEGQTLKKFIEGDGPGISKVLDIAIQCCDGLAAAHEKDIVHRDIKSENIMVTPKGQVKIMDFGLAKVKGATKLTMAGSTLGTAAYMSPEQARGEDLDARSDIFSLGVVLYELLTRRLPFRGEHHAALLYSLVNEEPSPIARYNEKVSPELQRIVSKALAKDRDDRYQHIDELLADLRRERKQLEAVQAVHASSHSVSPVGSQATRRPKSLLRYLVGAGAVVITVLLVIIFNPFNFQISTQKGTAAAHNSLAVMYFDNIVDPEDTDKTARMITSLLTTGLSESKSLTVMSSQRLYDILRQLGKEELKVIDKRVASAVAQKAGVGIVITGEVLQSNPNIVVTAQISEVDGGRILASEKIVGSAEDDILRVVDKLSNNLKKNLLTDKQAEVETTKTVAQVTTRSPEAYREYIIGIEYSHKRYWGKAAEHFERAITLDTTFAMAYFFLALSTPDMALSLPLLRNALRHIDRVTRRERELLRAFESFWIESDYPRGFRRLKDYVTNYPDDKDGHYWLGALSNNWRDYPTAIAAFTKILELDPYDKRAYQKLAYTYDNVGDFENSMWAINKYIALAPDEPSPYDTRGDLLSKHGKLAESIDSYRKALSTNPDFRQSLEKLGRRYIYAKSYTRADSCFRELTLRKDPRDRYTGHTNAMLMAMNQGRFQLAIDQLHRLLNKLSSELVFFEIVEARWNLALIHAYKHDYTSALREADVAIQIVKDWSKEQDDSSPDHGRYSYALLLAWSKDYSAAESYAEEFKRDIEKSDTASMPFYWRIIGEIERMKGNASASLLAWQKGRTHFDVFYSDFMLGRVYLEANKLGEAVSHLERAQLNYYDRTYEFWPLLHYYLGIAYEKSAWSDKAIGQYEEFLEILKNADTRLPEIEDARNRLANLGKVGH